jgi:hypothetical protein
MPEVEEVELKLVALQPEATVAAVMEQKDVLLVQLQQQQIQEEVVEVELAALHLQVVTEDQE